MSGDAFQSRGEETLIPALAPWTVLNISTYFKIISYHHKMVFWEPYRNFSGRYASCHALRIVMEYWIKMIVSHLCWSPQSPDLNIIGKIWHMITRKLHKNTKFIKTEQIS